MTLGERAELYCGIELPLFLGCGFVWEFAVFFVFVSRDFHWVACEGGTGEKFSLGGL